MRSWTAFQAWATRVVEDAARRWHGECRIVRDGEAWHFVGGEEEGKGRRAALDFRLSSPRVVPSGCVLVPPDAAVCDAVSVGAVAGDLGRVGHFRVPILRDVAMWAGARNVSRSTFLKSLDERGAVVLCPGGQAELVEHVGGQADDTVTLCTRLGIHQDKPSERAHLVPVFCFGESQALTNLWKWKAAQRWTYKRLGFPMPFLAVGWKGCLPLPAPLPLQLRRGRTARSAAARTGRRRDGGRRATGLRQYYARIADLFERYKSSSGFPHLRHWL